MELYLHIPFCVRKCLYCDFLSFPADEDLRRRYVEQLAAEIRSCGKRFRQKKLSSEVSSVFFGGGTPSLLTPDQISMLMEAVRESFLLLPEAEITIEANPGAFDETRVKRWREEGINRLSLGLQSSKREELACLGRIHSFADFLASFRLAREAGFDNINVDVMSALPGQTPESFRQTLEAVAGLSPEHISAYSLIIEEGTPFYQWYGETISADAESDSEPAVESSAGEMAHAPLPGEEADRQMYHETKRCLADYGCYRYEISNYAKPGRECRHNIGYWDGTDYLGLGLGAASLVDGDRFTVTRSLEEYLAFTPEELADGAQYREREVLTQKDRMEEFMFLGLRLTAGVSAAEFERRFGTRLESVYGEVLCRLEEEGLLVMEGRDEKRSYRLTEFGLDVSNYALAEFLL